MLEPKGYKDVQEFGEYEKLAPGGHVMKILKVEETTSRNGDDMIKIYLDTDKSDKQPGFFKKRYDGDTRENKKWGCIVNQLVIDAKTGLASRGLKTFHTCVEKSNSSTFKLVWGDKYADNFKGKLIGGLFRNEEYPKQDGKTTGWAVKLMAFHSVGAVLEGLKVPDDKPLDQSNTMGNFGSVIAPPPEAPAPTDEDYPF